MTTKLSDHTLYLSGALNLETVPRLWQQAEDWLKQGVSQFDLAQTDSIDSAGLAFLVTLATTIASQRTEPAWHHCPESLIRLMRLYDLELKSARLASTQE